MSISQYIVSLYEENIKPISIKTDNNFKFYENNFNVELSDKTIINIKIEKYVCVDPAVVEFYDSNSELMAKAKGFDSVL